MCALPVNIGTEGGIPIRAQLCKCGPKHSRSSAVNPESRKQFACSVIPHHETAPAGCILPYVFQSGVQLICICWMAEKQQAGSEQDCARKHNGPHCAPS